MPVSISRSIQWISTSIPAPEASKRRWVAPYRWLAVLMAVSLQAQTGPQISIEPAAPDGPRGGSLASDHVRAHGIPLDSLIAFAFQVDGWKIAGPEWIRGARYEVRANHEFSG
jgi:hypothetical protein